MVTKYYYWRKFELNEEWVDSEPDEYIDTRTGATGQVIRQNYDPSWIVFDNLGDYVTRMNEFRTDYSVSETSSGYSLGRSGVTPTITSTTTDRPNFNFQAEFDHGLSYTGWYNSNENIYFYHNGNLIEADINWFRTYDRKWDSTFNRWQFSHWSLNNLRKMSLAEKQQWLVREIGDWIDTVLAPAGSYPIEGEQGGYWWIRGEEYTIEIPELIYPDIGAEYVSGPEHFEFELKERMSDCPGNYHARLRVGMRSDFNRRLFFADTHNSSDRSNFEYWDGSSWASFPSGGVDGDTRVRYTVPAGVSWQPFTVYYWDAMAYHPAFGFSPPALFRSFLNMGDTDEFYLLLINGIPYKANSLRLVESSNGRIGRMDIRLLNY